MTDGFVYLDEAVPGVLYDAKYAGEDNFTGRRVDGYAANRVIGTLKLARALARAQALASAEGLTLFIWDAYRPARAVARFMRWADSPEDGLTKAAHYPNIDKRELVRLGYIAERSGHSRGSAVDLTLARADTGEQIDMGGAFDLMDARSWHGAAGLPVECAQNRARLRAIMEKSGCRAYENEWWHYSLADEPYPHTYFDFIVE